AALSPGGLSDRTGPARSCGPRSLVRCGLRPAARGAGDGVVPGRTGRTARATGAARSGGRGRVCGLDAALVPRFARPALRPAGPRGGACPPVQLLRIFEPFTVTFPLALTLI